jgi:SnoaL-like protein
VISDHEQIRQLVARYAIALDERDLDTLVGCFTPGLDRARLRADFERSLRPLGVTILNVGTHLIDIVDDGHATGRVYCKAEIQDGERWIHQAIHYGDTYERIDGRWYFGRRVHELFYGAPVGVNPVGLPPADWPAHHDGWGTVPERWGTWKHFQGGT